MVDKFDLIQLLKEIDLIIIKEALEQDKEVLVAIEEEIEIREIHLFFSAKMTKMPKKAQLLAMQGRKYNCDNELVFYLLATFIILIFYHIFSLVKNKSY